MNIFGAKIESSSSDNQTVLPPAGGLIQTSQGAAVDTSNSIKKQHNSLSTIWSTTAFFTNIPAGKPTDWVIGYGPECLYICPAKKA